MLVNLHPFLIVGLLFLLSLGVSSLSVRSKIPPLLFFLVLGMLAGVDGPGGLSFSDARLANHMGSVALAFILFSGGLETQWKDVRYVLTTGSILSTAGVFLTASVMAGFIWLVLGLSFIESFLIGAIISSTDAAAVFSVLRTQKCGLKGDLAPLLEFESASNDPMAIFLTTVTLSVIAASDLSLPRMFAYFVLQMVMGGVCGFGLGWLACKLVQKVKIDNESLYPVFGTGIMFSTFGLASLLGGNGYLAVYLCGIVMGNEDYMFKRSLVKFHEGFAWLMQISMFLILGLLVNPKELTGIVTDGLLVAFFLIFAARPLVVYICMLGSKYSLMEKLFVGWTGLRGAVPIILATYPFEQNYSNAGYIFNLIFFIVITSVLIQGMTLADVSRWLGLDSPYRSSPRYPLEYTKTTQSGSEETREIDILHDSYAVGRQVYELGFPKNVTILLIHRGNKFLIPKGDTVIASGDILLIFGEKSKLHGVGKKLHERPLEQGAEVV